MLVRSDALNPRGVFRPLSVLDVMEHEFFEVEHDTTDVSLLFFEFFALFSL
jgi:hypothetical protein